MNEVNPSHWDNVKRKTKSKVECVKRAQEKAMDATKDINKLKDLISRYFYLKYYDLLLLNIGVLFHDTTFFFKLVRVRFNRFSASFNCE